MEGEAGLRNLFLFFVIFYLGIFFPVSAHGHVRRRG